MEKAYKVGGIPLWVPSFNNFISAFIHLFIMSIMIFVIAPLTFNAKVPENSVQYFVSLGVFILTCLSLGTVLGLIIRGTHT